MKRKIWAVLMALVLVVGVVPTVAKAGDAGCEHENVEYVPTEPGYHDMKCTDCGYMYGYTYFTCKGADSDYDGTCDKCGYVYKAPAHTCDFKLESISDTQHQFKCDECKKTNGPAVNHSDASELLVLDGMQ